LVTKKVKKKTPAARGPGARTRTQAPLRGDDGAAKRAALRPDERDFSKREAEIRAAAREGLKAGRFSFADTVDVALQLWERAATHAAVIPILDRAIPGTQAAFDALPEYAGALRYLNRQHVIAAGTEGRARVPADVVDTSKALMDEMAEVLRYNLGRRDEIARRLAFLRSRTGYRHMWIALETYASLYEELADELAGDQRRYDPADATRARALSVQIAELTVAPKGGSVAEWAALRKAAHALVADAYERLARVLCAIENKRPRTEFATLGVVVNALRAPRTGRRAKKVGAPAGDAGSTAPTTHTPAEGAPPAGSLRVAPLPRRGRLTPTRVGARSKSPRPGPRGTDRPR
jgi:hypothetical protein